MSEAKEIQYRVAKPWRIAVWPLVGGVNNMFVMLMVFVSYVAAGGYGIAVVVAGMISTSTRIFDAITDPVIALISDRISTRFGKVRILLCIGYGIMTLSVFTLFFWGVGSNIVVFTVAYMIYIIGYTFFGVAQNMGNPIMTNEPKQRMMQARFKTVYTQVFSAAVSAYMSMVLAPKYGGLAMGAFQEMCITCVICGAVLLVISMIAVGPYDRMENFEGKDKSPVKMKDCISIIKHNKALWAFIAAASSDKLALQAASQSAISMLVFGVIIGNYKFYGSLSLITLIPAILIIFMATTLRKKGDTKSVMIQWTTISIALAGLMVVFMAVGNPQKISVVPAYTIAFLVLYCLFTGAKVVTSACNNAMIPDIVDYEMYRSGRYMPATVSALYAFVDKVISSLAATIVGACIAVVGYKTVMPQAGDPCTTPIFWMTMFLWMGLPILGWICTLVAMKFYPLDKEMMKEVQRKNMEVRGKVM